MKRMVMVVVLIVLLPLIGCGKKRNLNGGNVSGTITYKGKPVNGALLRLTSTGGPSDPDVPPIPVDQEGKFNASNIPPGEYKIVVEPSPGAPKGRSGGMPPMAKNMDAAKAEEMKRKLSAIQGDMPSPTIPIPNKYRRLESTTLKQTIAKGDQTLTLELTD
jgi:hypothetical protein